MPLTDFETALLLRYYTIGLGSGDGQTTSGGLHHATYGSLRVAWTRWDIGESTSLERDVALVREVPGASGDVRVWIADGGFTASLPARIARRGSPLPPGSVRDFGGTILLFPWPLVD